MGNLSFKIGWQINDVDSTERAFLGTYSTSDAKALRYKSYLGLWRNFDAKLAGPDNGA